MDWSRIEQNQRVVVDGESRRVQWTQSGYCNYLVGTDYRVCSCGFVCVRAVRAVRVCSCGSCATCGTLATHSPIRLFLVSIITLQSLIQPSTL
jgi:hypothetical protein